MMKAAETWMRSLLLGTIAALAVVARQAGAAPLEAAAESYRHYLTDDIGRALGISRATAARYWDYARSWLYSELRGPQADGEPAKKSPRS